MAEKRRRRKTETSERLSHPAARRDEMEEWLLSFLDLLTLLMAAFIFILAYASFYPETTTSTALCPPPQPIPPSLAATTTTPPPATGQAVGAPPASATRDEAAVANVPPAQPSGEMEAAIDPMTRKLAEQLKEKLKGFEAGPDLTVGILPGRITLSIQENILFPTGRSGLAASADAIMAQIAPALANDRYTLSIEGHTDNVPINNERYHSNWELSAARAISVVEQLQAKGIPAHRLRAVAYADTQPVADNADPAGRGRNRRVVITIHVDKTE